MYRASAVVCDSCGFTLHSHEIERAAFNPVHHEREYAATVGWKYENGRDVCPKCAASTGDKTQ